MNTVKMPFGTVTYPELTPTTVEAAGMTAKFWEFAVDKLIAHKANSKVWDAFAAATGIKDATGASVRKDVNAVKPAKDGEEVTVAQMQAALSLTPARWDACVEAASKAAASMDLIELIKAERSRTAKVDPMLLNARAILLDTARFAALEAAMKKAGLKAKLNPVEGAVHAALFALAEIVGTPFEG